MKKLLSWLFCIISVNGFAQTPEEDVAIGIQLMSEGQADSAFMHFLSAAEHGSIEGMHATAMMYTLGEGTPKNKEAADFWFTRSAHRGFGKAYPYLADIHLKNNQKDSAIFYLEQVADFDATVPAKLGKIYLDDEDYRTAFMYFKKGTDAGDPVAMYHLAEMYYDGEGVEYNEREAVKWWQQSAKRNYQPAQEYLEDLGYDDLEEIDAPRPKQNKSPKKKSKKSEEDEDQAEWSDDGDDADIQPKESKRKKRKQTEEDEASEE